MRPALLVLTWLAACGHPASPPSPPTPSLPPTATTPPAGDDPADRDPACTGDAPLVVVERTPATATWQGSTVVGGQGELEVHRCGPGVVEVVRLEVGAPARWIRQYDRGTQRVLLGHPLILAAQGDASPSSRPVQVMAIDEQGATLVATATLTSLDDPTRVAALAACRTCGGTWAARGLAGVEDCDCPTRDADRPCTSDRDCEGVCLATGWEPVTAAARDACPRGQRLEQLVGRCSARTLAFGCLPRIDEPATSCEVAGSARRLPTICTD